MFYNRSLPLLVLSIFFKYKEFSTCEFLIFLSFLFKCDRLFPQLWVCMTYNYPSVRLIPPEGMTSAAKDLTNRPICGEIKKKRHYLNPILPAQSVKLMTCYTKYFSRSLQGGTLCVPPRLGNKKSPGRIGLTYFICW